MKLNILTRRRVIMGSLIVVGVGYHLNTFKKSQVSHIKLKESGRKVNIKNIEQPVLIGETFEESEKIDKLFDIHGSYLIKEYKTFNNTSHQ